MKKTKLELTWPGKEERPRLEPRILLEHPERDHHAAARREGDLFDNMLIKGDNLLALKALEQDYAGKVKCVFIDPPYGTGADFLIYDDGLQHSQWLSMMRNRLDLFRRLLSEDGSIWIHIDDNEVHYLKIVLDEIFGRANFVASLIWQKALSVKNTAQFVSDDHEYILVYARDIEKLKFNKVAASEAQAASYKNPDNDPRGAWQSISFSARNYYSKGIYPIKCPGGRVIPGPPAGSYWRVSEENMKLLDQDNRVWWGKDGNGVPRRKMFLSEQGELKKVAQTLWLHSSVGHTQEAKKESLALFKDDPFPTPKPERLVSAVLEIATNENDLVLDSFAGSGTTGAVAHKMKRRWIMAEIGDHADTHIVPRLIKVIDGEDQGGITKAAGWEGGGGFRYYTLAPSLLERDAYDNWVIAPEYNGPMLAQAMCKHLGFTYDPAQSADGDERDAEWWRHGRSSERDFLYVTTQALTQDALRLLSDEVGPDRSLLICARAFSGNIDNFENLTCRKIPASILSKCEWGRDDYSLNIAALPEREAADDIPYAGPLFAGEPTNG